MKNGTKNAKRNAKDAPLTPAAKVTTAPPEYRRVTKYPTPGLVNFTPAEGYDTNDYAPHPLAGEMPPSLREALADVARRYGSKDERAEMPCLTIGLAEYSTDGGFVGCSNVINVVIGTVHPCDDSEGTKAA